MSSVALLDWMKQNMMEGGAQINDDLFSAIIHKNLSHRGVAQLSMDDLMVDLYCLANHWNDSVFNTALIMSATDVEEHPTLVTLAITIAI